MKQRLLILTMAAAVGCGPGPIGTPGPAILTVTPVTWDFNDAAAGTISAPATFTVKNTGESPSSAMAASVTGPDAAQFQIGNNDCAAAGTLNVGVTCTFTADFRPTGSAGVRNAMLSVQAGVVTAGATVSGTVPPLSATMSLSPATHNFGYSGNFDFTVTNTGGAASGSPVVSLSGPHAGNFSILTNGCTASLAAAASCVITVRFNGLEGSSTASAWLNVSFPAGAVTPSHLTGLGL